MNVHGHLGGDGSSPRIVDFCDMDQFETILRDWANATGLATVAVGDDGNYISDCYNFTEFCHGLTRTSPEGLRRCVECDKHGAGIYLCHAGLVDFASPITLEDGTLLGNIVGGQVLPEQPDEERFRATARELDIDEDAYIGSLRKVNVRTREQIEASFRLLGSVANHFVRSSYAARMNEATLAERSRIISSLSKIYFCDYFIDLDGDHFLELDATERLHAFVGHDGIASELVPAAIMNFAKEEYRADFLRFADLSTLAERMVGHQSIAFEFSARDLDWCRALFIPVDEDASGRVTRVIYAIQDIHEEKEHDLEVRRMLEKSVEEARLASDAKSEFLSRMSHDIRTPLNGIIGMTYLTQEMHDLPPEARENLAKIDMSSKFLLGLINDILDMAKAESGKIELHLEPYPFDEFMGYLDAVIRPLCAEKGQHLEFNIGPRRLKVAPVADKLRTSQIIFNVLSNAVKYTPEGGTIVYSVDEHWLPDGRVAIDHTISDTGIGMSQGFLDHLFEPFTQEGRNDISELRGSGLGLAIVKRLIDAMGGSIEVESELGHGTTFKMHFAFDAVPLDDDQDTPAVAATSGDHGQLHGKRVLLCEDHPLNQEIARSLLEERGVLVDIAEDGEAGLHMIENSSVGFYDAVLMDVRMPVMGGYETTRAIRALDRQDLREVPIIAMTADAFDDDVRTCLDAGMNAHLAKPIDPETLYATLGKVLHVA